MKIPKTVNPIENNKLSDKSLTVIKAITIKAFMTEDGRIFNYDTGHEILNGKERVGWNK